MNQSDPFGLDVSVNCRPVDVSDEAAHCAVRVQNDNIDVTVELMPDTTQRGPDAKLGRNQIHWRNGSPAEYRADGWVRVEVPPGMSSEDFDRAVLNSAANAEASYSGRPYSPHGKVNSNSFVKAVINGAGGTVPKSAADGFLFGAPGLCGGGLYTGNKCSP